MILDACLNESNAIVLLLVVGLLLDLLVAKSKEG
jgi:hypothetical protein